MAEPKTMRAILIEKFVRSPHDLQISKIPIPKPFTPSTLLVRITHASLTHVDVLYSGGKHQNNRRHVQPPFVLGNEFAGIIIQSPAFSSFKPGDRVFGGALGSYAEVIAVEESNVRKVPKEWTLREACAVGSSGAISWACLKPVAKVEKGMSVLVTGAAGGLGVMACQVALALGARVIGVVGDAEKAKVVRNLGVEDVVGYNLPGWENKIVELTGGEGVDVVYDVVGVVESALKCLKYGGKVVVVGYAGRGGVMESVKMNKVLLKGATIMGYRFGEHGRRFPSEVEAIWQSFMKMVEDGTIRPIVYKEEYQGLESVSRGLQDMETRNVWGRAVVEIAKEEEVKREIEEERARL